MSEIVISGTGLYTPPESISNEELVASFNQYVHQYNLRHKAAIEKSEMEALRESSVEFIEKASGIKSRHVVNKSGILNIDVMHPLLPERPDTEPSIQCEMSVAAAQQAMATAKKTAADIDAVLVACSNMQRPYPAIAVEVQQALGVEGFAFDLNVACSSATFGIQTAVDSIFRGHAKCILIVNPEICSAHLNFRDRDSHFIFGDACTAMLVERADTCKAEQSFEIIGTKLLTVFSNNIRNNFGFMNRTDPASMGKPDKLFVQEGRKVFKEVVPAVVNLITEHLAGHKIQAQGLRRLWLHQANINMNRLIATKLLGREPTEEEAPITLDEYANTSSAAAIIAFHKYHQGLQQGDLGIICSFGAGYSAGNVIVKTRGRPQYLNK